MRLQVGFFACLHLAFMRQTVRKV
jgi:hypothetical protein